MEKNPQCPTPPRGGAGEQLDVIFSTPQFIPI